MANVLDEVEVTLDGEEIHWHLVKNYKLPAGKKARKNKHSTNEKKRAAARR